MGEVTEIMAMETVGDGEEVETVGEEATEKLMKMLRRSFFGCLCWTHSAGLRWHLIAIHTFKCSPPDICQGMEAWPAILTPGFSTVSSAHIRTRPTR